GARGDGGRRGRGDVRTRRRARSSGGAARRMRGTTLRRGGATQLGDLPDLESPAGRTTAVRILLVFALMAALAAAILLARSAGSGRAAVLPEGAKTGVVVVDMSGSVSGLPF